MEARKAVKRMTKQSARNAMVRHVAKMKQKGWKISQEFEGDAGLMFECIVHFSKGTR